ncbi:MAG: sigma 54-interacting transcriptional regulator [Thermoanaerobaculaceae bacterium]
MLRLLQEREVRRVGATRTRTVDVRFVAATNRDLAAAVAAGAFRPDLFYRLSVGVVRMPPLRERPDDVEELARYFVHRCAAAFGRLGVRLAPASIGVLRAGGWPGKRSGARVGDRACRRRSAAR